MFKLHIVEHENEIDQVENRHSAVEEEQIETEEHILISDRLVRVRLERVDRVSRFAELIAGIVVGHKSEDIASGVMAENNQGMAINR